MSDIYGKMLQGDLGEKLKFERFLSFCTHHPSVRILDPWENVKTLLDRKSTYESCVNAAAAAAAAAAARGCSSSSSLFHVPNTVFLNSIQDPIHAIQFPVICKRQTACATGGSHQMALVPSSKHVSDLNPYFGADEPVILQQFIQHDGVLFKVYVADGHLYTYTRPSLQNTFESVVTFDSQTLPKTFGSSAQQQPHVVTDTAMQKQKVALVDHERLHGIADRLQCQLGLTMFGFDVVVESGRTDAYHVVDVNYFPSFAEVDDFHQVFIKILRRHLSM
ncbi:inositol-tetrakisphosphate 1-kinase [Zychaea mexicana]|uniref:inositol-tetrakisphosphate 1-kinase n=1 Tax=Zychaea mexicana TaxID=64656 RepID=UPI0022FE151D|nr:inositol-tetrakisphosphate 1-kinase [Zychaea mexicana]KAI9494059.1 inositol-tetrakisphosphate 1-kinase [Zychaea mexicana]